MQKRALFEAWLAAHHEFSFLLAPEGHAISRRELLARLTSLTGRQNAPEYIYLLMERRMGDETPAYIGKSREPLRRWAQHLAGLLKGEGSYARWRARLLREGHDTVRFDLQLYVVGESQVHFPPMPGFPTTIGAVEYQLVGLAADAYPMRLLNFEGQAR